MGITYSMIHVKFAPQTPIVSTTPEHVALEAELLWLARMLPQIANAECLPIRWCGTTCIATSLAPGHSAAPLALQPLSSTAAVMQNVLIVMPSVVEFLWYTVRKTVGMGVSVPLPASRRARAVYTSTTATPVFRAGKGPTAAAGLPRPLIAQQAAFVCFRRLRRPRVVTAATTTPRAARAAMRATLDSIVQWVPQLPSSVLSAATVPTDQWLLCRVPQDPTARPSVPPTTQLALLALSALQNSLPYKTAPTLPTPSMPAVRLHALPTNTCQSTALCSQTGPACAALSARWVSTRSGPALILWTESVSAALWRPTVLMLSISTIAPGVPMDPIRRRRVPTPPTGPVLCVMGPVRQTFTRRCHAPT
jgi:hypothetical protein